VASNKNYQKQQDEFNRLAHSDIYWPMKPIIIILIIDHNIMLIIMVLYQ